MKSAIFQFDPGQDGRGFAEYGEAILLNTHGIVAEGTGENIFRVRDDALSTPPASSGILRGVTSDVVIQFARDEGIKFYRNDFTREELFASVKVFLSSTAVGITSVREVDGRKIGNGGHSPLTSRMQKLYRSMAHGTPENPKYEKWLTHV